MTKRGKELIDALREACDLFDKTQEKKAVLEAEKIIEESQPKAL